MKKLSCGIVGLGFVGNACYQTFKKHFDVFTYDLDKAKCNISSIKEMMNNTKIVFLAVPTPMQEDGSIYLQNIHSVMSKLNKYSTDHIIVIKSSVAPGTCAMLAKEYTNLRVVFNPEFLREKTAIEDFRNQDRIVLGGKGEDTSEVKELYAKIYNLSVPIVETDLTTAEMVKFMTNIYLAAKVSLCNEFYQICQKLNVNYDEMRDITCLDKRILKDMTQVPGDGTPTSAPGFGFSGSCWPVNLEILITTAQKLGVEPVIMNAIKDRNKRIDRSSNIDWLIEGKTIVSKKHDE